jgi:hypothetical protein
MEHLFGDVWLQLMLEDVSRADVLNWTHGFDDPPRPVGNCVKTAYYVILLLQRYLGRVEASRWYMRPERALPYLAPLSAVVPPDDNPHLHEAVREASWAFFRQLANQEPDV